VFGRTEMGSSGRRGELSVDQAQLIDEAHEVVTPLLSEHRQLRGRRPSALLAREIGMCRYGIEGQDRCSDRGF
jgi:hypothetical protein